jgi:FMN-dependent NADH-azoreductase
MPNLLHLDSSADLETSRSRALTAAFAEAWRSAGPDHLVTRRDLHRDPLPHLPDASLHWPERFRPVDAAPPAEAIALQDKLIDELLAADAVLIGAPLYNYTVPSTLKAWIDYVHVPGETAPFDEDTQPLAGRPAVIVTSQGSVYDKGTMSEGRDHEVPVLDIVMNGMFGMDTTIVTVPLGLAHMVPSLAGMRDRAERDYSAAHVQLIALAQDLAKRLA